MDVIFNCEFCEQELAVDATGAGTEIECPSCGQRIVIPDPTEASVQPHPVNPIASSAAAKEEKHFSVPQHSRGQDLIEKPKPPLEVQARQGITLRVKTFKRSDCVEVGKDHFDEHVSRFLETVGESNIVSVTPITYSHQEMAGHQWITDFGVVILYKG